VTPLSDSAKALHYVSWSDGNQYVAVVGEWRQRTGPENPGGRLTSFGFLDRAAGARDCITQ